MKRIDEKVKDLVDVRSYVNLTDFAADPIRTLMAYRFTDVTADLMAKWLHRIAELGNGGGHALALAGFRGVGKSHFLATLGIIAANPELRNRIDNDHVAAAAGLLARKQFPVIKVGRGTRPSLLEELRASAAKVIGRPETELGDDAAKIIEAVVKYFPNTPTLFLIDTSSERTHRVGRDDGDVLSQIAISAKNNGAFVCVALDDDIAGADGANSAIVSAFSIDYLDQDHLFKIVDSFIFPKHQRMLPLLRSIFEYYRDSIPGFRWGEQRFCSLYPLHPAIMEIAPFVRLFLHDFALLGFASEAGARILGRPANSIIAPDEVFDNIEVGLRNVDALKDVFEAYDRLNASVVASTPVMKRLQAKLVLKGLLLFSLNDEGATASELCSAMLIYDEADPHASVPEIEAILKALMTNEPSIIRSETTDAGKERFCFILGGTSDFKNALAQASEEISEENVWGMLRRFAKERFQDIEIGDSVNESYTAHDVKIKWRGGLRRGQLIWAEKAGETHRSNSGVEWTTIIEPHSTAEVSSVPENGIVRWKTAEMTSAEIGAIRRFAALQTNSDLREGNKDLIASSLQSHARLIDKCLQRVLLDDATIIVEGFEYNFTEDARSSDSVTNVLSVMLEPLYEAKFPMHPYFQGLLSMDDVSRLAADLFGEANADLEEVQKLAAAYCVPLGIVVRSEDRLVPAGTEILESLPISNLVLGTVASAKGNSEKLDNVLAALSRSPYGIGREGAFLVITAIVAARMLEFVTVKGERISNRSLDLTLIWDDIAAVALPGNLTVSNERLAQWATLLINDGVNYSLRDDEKRSELKKALHTWLDIWTAESLQANFDRIDDTTINAGMWRASGSSLRIFGSVARSISSINISGEGLENCLANISELFADSEDELQKRSAELEHVRNFVNGDTLRSEARSYALLTEYTANTEIESLRRQIFELLNGVQYDFTSELGRKLESALDKFMSSYADLYRRVHDSTVSSGYLREKLNEIQSTDVWWEYENLSRLNNFDPDVRAKVNSNLQKMASYECDFDTEIILRSSPRCACGFELMAESNVEKLPHTLWKILTESLVKYRSMLRNDDKQLQILSSEASGEVKEVLKLITDPSDFRRFSDRELELLGVAYGQFPRVLTERKGSTSIKKETPANYQESFSELAEMVESLG